MSLDVEDLILQPFRELVERGDEAVANAEAAEDENPKLSKELLKAARGLVKEGERALQRVQPLLSAYTDKYGDAFREAIRGNDDMVEAQRVLEDLLYDLDDFIELDNFDGDKFSKVQAASKAFARCAMETFKRLRLEETAPKSRPPSAFPPLPPLPPLDPGRVSSLSNQENGAVCSPTTSIHGKPLALNTRPLSTSTRSSRSDGRPNHAASNASTAKMSQLSFGGHRVEASLNDDAASPKTAFRESSILDTLGAEFGRVKIVSQPSSPDRNDMQPFVAPIPRTMVWVDQHAISSPQETIPEDSVTSYVSPGKDFAKPKRRAIDSLTSTSSVFDTTSPTTTHATTAERTSVLSTASNPVTYHTALLATVPTSDTRTTSRGPPPFTPLSSETQGLVRATTEPPRESGLIPANELNESVGQPEAGNRNENCSIGIDSTLYQLKGFCDGARTFRNGGLKEATTASMEYGTRISVARCNHCEYRHTLAEMELDTNQDSRANFCKEGVLFRLRFLFKSHLSTHDTFNTSYYGCLFCAHEHQTVREGDATVFTTQNQLFAHLSRHPQPLPFVPGITVLYGKMGDYEHNSDDKEDYDLHFTDPPAVSPISEADSAMLVKLPVGRTLKNHVRRYGERELTDPDGNSDGVLPFLVGSHIIGIDFPEKWGGKWCMGWYDGVRGSFPAKLIALDPPSSSQVRLAGLNSHDGTVVTARWKWKANKGSPGWLSFDKGDTIQNVSWLDQDQWFWVGMTKSGAVGVFPRSHIKVDSLRDGSNSKSGRKNSGPPRLFALRRTQSYASSTSG